MKSRAFRFALLLSFSAVTLSAARPQFSAPQIAPPGPPIPAVPASRGAMLLNNAPHSGRLAAQALPAPPNPSRNTVILPLSAGLSMISIPLRTDSQLLSDLLPNLPIGARVWTWNAATQNFVEGFDQQLALGQGALLYLPAPTVLVVTGDTDTSSEIPFELHNGWNLVGVPYTDGLVRPQQMVYISSVPTTFNEAADQGAIVDPVFSLDVSGYQEVESDGMFAPMRAYWVYSNGAELLEMSPFLLGIPDRFDRWMVAEKLGTIALNWAAGELFAQISPDPNQKVLDKLAEIDNQLKDIQKRLDNLDTQFKATQLQISMVEQAILQATKEVNLNAVRDNVNAHYDDASAQNLSFMWFETNAISPTGRKNITDANKLAFANNVLGTWNFLKDFQTVRSAIIPDSGDGVLDHFANQIVLQQLRDGNGAPVAKGTLEDRYKAMEVYFNRLVGVQYRIMLLLTNAWNATAAVPGDTSQADNWRKTTYANAIRDEALRFRDAAEKIVAGTLRVAAEPSEAPVSVPAEVIDTILPSLDFGVMNLAPEPQGVRVRVFVGTNLNENDTYSIVDDKGQVIFGLPSADSGAWKTLPSGAPYDAWRINSADSVPQVSRSTSWIMYRATVTSIPFGVYKLRLVDKFGLTDDRDTPALYGFRSVRVGNVDETNKPSPSGKTFGTVTLVKRAAARTMLRIPNDGKTQYWNYCPANVVKLGKEDDYFIISGNCYNSGGWASFQRFVPFTFAGPGGSAAGDWLMGLRTSIVACNARQEYCLSGSYSLGQIELSDNGSTMTSKDGISMNIVRTDSATQVSYHLKTTWQTGHTYKFQFRLLHTGTSNGTASQIWRGPLMIRFDP